MAKYVWLGRRTGESCNLCSLSSQEKHLKFRCKCEIRKIQRSLFSFPQLLEKIILYTFTKVETFWPCILLRCAESHLKYFLTGVIPTLHGLLNWILLNLKRKNEENPRLIFQTFKVCGLQAATYIIFYCKNFFHILSLFQISILHRKFSLILQNYIPWNCFWTLNRDTITPPLPPICGSCFVVNFVIKQSKFGNM